MNTVINKSNKFKKKTVSSFTINICNNIFSIREH